MQYKVAVQVLTYNQKDYIVQCLDSIVNQRTNFPFVAVVYDDASTDGTADIVRDYAERYPDIIHPLLQKENQYSKGNNPARIAGEEINRLNPKYKCILDGDDLWTDMDLLQMHYDFLESHPDHAVVYGRVKQLLPGGEIKEFHSSYRWELPTLESLLIRNNIPINATMFRLDAYREYLEEIKPFEKGWMIQDWAIWLYMVAKYKVEFIDRPVTLYRITPVSITRQKSLHERLKYINNLRQIPLFFCKYSKESGIRKEINKHFNKMIRTEIIDEIKKLRPLLTSPKGRK